MAQHLAIRRALAADASAVSSLILSHANQFSADLAAAAPGWFLALFTPQAIEGYITDPKISYFVGELDRALVGVVSVRDNKHVFHLFVAESVQRNGVARALWAHAKAEAVANGNNEGFSVRSTLFAVPIYERFGFRISQPRVEEGGIAYVPMRLESDIESHG